MLAGDLVTDSHDGSSKHRWFYRPEMLCTNRFAKSAGHRRPDVYVLYFEYYKILQIN